MNAQKILAYASAISGAMLGLLGGFDSLLYALIIFMIVDYISGVISAMFGKSTKTQDGKLSSKAGAIGIFKKILIMLCVLIANSLDKAVGQQNVFRNACIMFYICNEGLSFVENLNNMGIAFPKKIQNMLSKMKDEN